jgi:hypothetical protein
MGCADDAVNEGEALANCEAADRAARIIQDALGIESDGVVNYCFPKGLECASLRNARANEYPIERRRALRA